MTILSLSGFIPEQICDIRRFTGYHGESGISHFCGYASDYISQVLQDETVDGAVFPRSCDSCRTMAVYLAECGKFVHQLHVPARRDEMAVSYLAEGLRRYQKAVEAYYGVTINDIPERIELVNARNRALAGLYEQLPELSFADYLDMLHRLLRTPLREQRVEPPQGRSGGGKRVFLVGSMLTGMTAVRAIEEAGLVVVGDRLTESRRLFSAPEVSLSGDIYENMARSILGALPSPTQSDLAAILKEDQEEIRTRQVQGVIFVTQKYCEPYDFLYASYARMLEDLQIPVLRLTLSDSTDTRDFAALVEAFSDIL